MNVERIKFQVSKLKAVGGGAVGIVTRHRRIAAAVVGGALVLTPLLTGSPEVFLLNMVGIGLIALLVRRTAMAVQRRHRKGRR